MAVLPALVQPGAVARVAVSYVEDALVKVIVYLPQQRPFWLYDTTDSHGHLTMPITVPPHVTLRHGHAVAYLFVRAMSGPWHKLAALSPVVRPGASSRIVVSYKPWTPVRAIVTFPGARSLRLVDVTDAHGHLQLTVTVPHNVRLHHGRAVAQVTVSALASNRSAQAAHLLSISDMVVSVARSPIVLCLQTQTVHVAYHPNVRLHIVVLFPHNRKVPLTAQTDRQGIATVRLELHYVKAPHPLRIGVEAIDTSARPPRLERVAFAVALPPSCRGPTGRS